MNAYSTSKNLIANVKNFLDIKPYAPWQKIDENTIFYGWGRKKSGLKAVQLAKKYKAQFRLLEDGFIRSLGLGVERSPSFSLISDDLGIYYDATQPSRLEKLLNEYDFKSDKALLEKAKKAIELIKSYEISKYNDNLALPKDFFKADEKRVLIITQSANDASLKYGLSQKFSTLQMIEEALKENKNAQIYIKIHPDVLTGKKKSDFKAQNLPKNVKIIDKNYNPIALLKHFDKVYTKTSGMGFEALLCGCECVCYGMPFYAGWGLTQDMLHCARRNQKRSVEEIFAAAYLLYTSYFNPYQAKKSDIFDTINTVYKYKKIEQINSNRLFFLGFSLWKRHFTKPFFKAKNNEIIFLNSLQQLSQFRLDTKDKIFIWGNRFSKDEIYQYVSKEVAVFFVEDGFIRSVSLGSDLTRFYSLVVDSKGLFINPNEPSDLENLLQNHHFDENLLQRAKSLAQKLIESKISKYNNATHLKLQPKNAKGQKIILIPAQVEDDASMILGGFGMNTQTLIKEVRQNNKNAYILFKPHPDVLSGNRKGLKDEKIILEFCDEIITATSIHSCLEIADEVHTITSTVGFEALLRRKKVVVYGMPFYAGWGLSEDKRKCERRNRKLSLEELVAGVLILYPRYISVRDKNLCEIELCLDTMLKLQEAYFSNKWFKIANDLRNFTLRKIRRIYEKLVG